MKHWELLSLSIRQKGQSFKFKGSNYKREKYFIKGRQLVVLEEKFCILTHWIIKQWNSLLQVSTGTKYSSEEEMGIYSDKNIYN